MSWAYSQTFRSANCDGSRSGISSRTTSKRAGSAKSAMSQRLTYWRARATGRVFQEPDGGPRSPLWVGEADAQFAPIRLRRQRSRIV